MKQRGPLIVAGAGAVIAILVIMMLIMPKLAQIKTANDGLSAAVQQQSLLETQLRTLNETAAKAKAIRTQLDLLDAAVPTQIREPEMIRMLNDTADQAGVDFMSISPGTPITVGASLSTGSPGATGASGTDATVTPPPAESTAPPAESIAPAAPVAPTLPVSISIMPVNILIQGSYFAVDEYLFRLENLPRLSKVLTISLTTGTDGYPQLSLTLTANFYTTDTSSGPGSLPGAQTDAQAPVDVPGGSAGGSLPAPTGTQAG
jgi:Tfp pilus assembly protein PilO